MTEVMQGLVNEARKNRFSAIGPTLSEEDVVSVWDNVSSYVDRLMSQQKGVHIPGLGTFTFTQKKIDIGNNKFILLQRPVFIVSEKFAQTHGLHYAKHHTTGQIPVVQLNFSALSSDSPFDRDTVESCVREVLQALSRSLAAKRNVEFTFAGIGRLAIRESKVKMKFYKEFLNSMDGSGKLVDALRDRPGTVDSVMSDRSPSRPHTGNTLILPRISSGSKGFAPEDGAMSPRQQKMTTIQEDDSFDEEAGEPLGFSEEAGNVELNQVSVEMNDAFDPKKASPLPPSRASSRAAAPLAKATGVCFSEDLMPPQQRSTHGSPAFLARSPRHSLSPINGQQYALERSSPLQDRLSPEVAQKALSPVEIGEILQSKMADTMDVSASAPAFSGNAIVPNMRSGSACGHNNSGQELCYLCHQRDRRNIPVNFTEERRRREQEEDRLLQQYQQMKDTEAILTEQEGNLGKRHENQKMAAFNLGVSEAVKSKKLARPTEFHPSYVFQKRPLTPPRFLAQDRYFNDLSKQSEAKQGAASKRAADEQFLERLEQVQLAEDLAAQREQYLKDKAEAQEQYKRALSAQIELRELLADPVVLDSKPNKIRASKRLGPLTIPRPKVLLPFSQSETLDLKSVYSPGGTKVRFKPLPLPSREPDSTEPVFGRFDMTNEKMADKRQRAHSLYRDQLAIVDQRKRDAILKRLSEQNEEEEMLARTKRELLDDRAKKYERMCKNRNTLESNWRHAADTKHHRELEERLRSMDPGVLLHEQCDKYHRCKQCKRTLANCGESNIWSESRYIPGSRLMV